MLMNHQENCGIHHKMCAFPQECLIEHLRAKLETNRDEHYRREEKVMAELAETRAKLTAETARADAAESLLEETAYAVADIERGRIVEWLHREARGRIPMSSASTMLHTIAHAIERGDHRKDDE